MRPDEQLESMTATERTSTPQKANFASETVKLRRSPNKLHTRDGHSSGTKDKRYGGELTFSKENDSSCLANEKTNGKIDKSQPSFRRSVS